MGGEDKERDSWSRIRSYSSVMPPAIRPIEVDRPSNLSGAAGAARRTTQSWTETGAYKVRAYCGTRPHAHVEKHQQKTVVSWCEISHLQWRIIVLLVVSLMAVICRL